MELDPSDGGIIAGILTALGMIFRAGRKTQQLKNEISEARGEAKEARDEAKAALHGLKEVCETMATHDDLERTIGDFRKGMEELKNSVERMHTDTQTAVRESRQRIDRIYDVLVNRGQAQ